MRKTRTIDIFSIYQFPKGLSLKLMGMSRGTAGRVAFSATPKSKVFDCRDAHSPVRIEFNLRGFGGGNRMSLNELQAKILKPFVDETIESLALMAGLKATAGEPFEDDVSKFRFKGYAVAAETRDRIDGVILMHHYIETALGISNNVCAMIGADGDATEMNEELEDALTEWGNTVVGRATKELSSNDLGIKFLPPFFVNDTEQMSSLLTGVHEILSIPIHVEDVGRFYFNYLLHHQSVPAQSDDQLLPKDSKILLVDDMKMIRNSLKRYLAGLGYENIVEAENGAQAVEKFVAEKPAILFMDVVMPEVTGPEALAKIRAVDTHTPVVMLSSVADDNVVAECEQLGIEGYIIKPLTKESGPETLQKFLVKK